MHEEYQEQHQKKTAPLNSIITFLIAVAGIFSVAFFLPFSGISLDFAKVSMFSIVVIGAVILWAIACLRSGTLTLPRSVPVWVFLGIVLVTIISALFSDAVKVSFFGVGYETTTAMAVIILALSFFLANLFIRTPRQVSLLYVGFIGMMLVLALYESARFIWGPEVFSFGVFNNLLANPIGKWNDLALLFGLSGALSLLGLSAFSPRGILRVVLISNYIFSLLVLFVANFLFAWGLFAFSAIAISGFLLMSRNLTLPSDNNDASTPQHRFNYHLPLLPLMSAIIAIVFLFLGGNIADSVSGRIGLSNIEVRPSWSATLDIMKQSVKEDPILGIGPNRFSYAWALYKPSPVNDTLFWNADFEQGIGTIPSFVVTVGVLGALLWILFLASFIRIGMRAVFVPRSEMGTPTLLFGSFLSAVYLFLAMFLYVPSAALVILAFLFGGVTLGIIARENPAHDRQYVFSDNPRIGFISVLALVVVLILSIVGIYTLSQRFIGTAYVGSATQSFAAGDIIATEEKLSRAYALFPHDSVARTQTEVAIVQIRNVLADTIGDDEVIRTRFQNTLSNALSLGKNALAYDEKNYLNWVALGRVYEAIVPLNVDGAYENARAAYEKAETLNPKSPAMSLLRARLEVAHGDLRAAREYLEKAIEVKGNYTEAIFALSQLEAQEGNVNGAITQTERAALIAPNDMGVFFQLGFLRYTIRDYSGAIVALERTISLNPVYANAKYFLGLSYAKIGRVPEAVQQFEEIEALNPDNVEVKSILQNLRSGNDPLAAIVPPDVPPEERENLPIEE